jgi:hypothetical protein
MIPVSPVKSIDRRPIIVNVAANEPIERLEWANFRLALSGFATQIGLLTQVHSPDNCYSAARSSRDHRRQKQ